MLHGWRIADRKHMRMSGYAARVTSLGWTAGGHWLATSGATQLILWPFQAKDGPMGKQPRLLAPSEHRVEVVACHPRQDIVAAGYADGMVLLVRIEDGAEILAKKPGDAPVTALGLERGRPLPRLRHRRRRGRRARPRVDRHRVRRSMFLKAFAGRRHGVRRPAQFPRLQARVEGDRGRARSHARAPSPARRNYPTPTQPGSSRMRCAGGPASSTTPRGSRISPP